MQKVVSFKFTSLPFYDCLIRWNFSSIYLFLRVFKRIPSSDDENEIERNSLNYSGANFHCRAHIDTAEHFLLYVHNVVRKFLTSIKLLFLLFLFFYSPSFYIARLKRLLLWSYSEKREREME